MFGRLQTWLYWRGLRKQIAKYGWTGVQLGGDGSQGPVWAYSVGFWESANGPEIIVFGQPDIVSNGLLWEVWRQLRGGLIIKDCDSFRLEGFEGRWRKVDPIQIREAEWLNCARRYRRERTGSEEFEAFQLFVADDAGKYPWEEGFDESWRRYQVELYSTALLPEPHARRLAAEGRV